MALELFSRDESRMTTTFLGYTITDEHRDQMIALGLNPWEGHPLQKMADGRR